MYAWRCVRRGGGRPVQGGDTSDHCAVALQHARQLQPQLRHVGGVLCRAGAANRSQRSQGRHQQLATGRTRLQLCTVS